MEQVKNNLNEFKNIKNRRSYTSRLWKKAFQYKQYFILLIFSTIFFDGLALISPLITQEILDKVKYANDINMPIGPYSVLFLLITLGILIALSSISGYIDVLVLKVFEQHIEFDYKREMYQKVLRSEVKIFDSINEGFFMARMRGDAVKVSMYARQVPKNIAKIVLILPLGLILIFINDWQFGLISVGYTIMGVVITMFTRAKFQIFTAKHKVNTDRVNVYLTDTVGGIREIKNFSVEDVWNERFSILTGDFKKSWNKYALLWGRHIGVQTGITAIWLFTFIIFGTYKVRDGQMTVTTLLVLNLYARNMATPILSFADLFNVVVNGTVSMKRIYDFLDMDDDSYDGSDLKISKGEIEFKDLYLKYDNTDKHAINGLNLKINAGETVALVGKTGAGKSTILKALMKYYKLSEGQILVDSQTIEDINVMSLRNNISFMEQSPFISFDTIKNNIIFDQKNITDEEYKEALRLSQSKQFIDSLDKGDETILGPNGITLSGGQRQRIALARAFLKKSKIILFDEATSALDNKTELLIKKAIKEITKDKTTIIIAHRLSTVRDADRVVLLENGVVIEEGTHSQLMRKKGEFYKLAQTHELGVEDE